MELQRALDNGYVLIAKEGTTEMYSNINSDFNSKKGTAGYIIEYVNSEYVSMLYITKELLKQIYNNVK